MPLNKETKYVYKAMSHNIGETYIRHAVEYLN